MGSLELDTTERLHFHCSLSCIVAGNGNPLQCSCLENPRDGGAWWAAISGVTQSRTRLKRLSSSSNNILSKQRNEVDSSQICLKFHHMKLRAKLFLLTDEYRVADICDSEGIVKLGWREMNITSHSRWQRAQWEALMMTFSV